MNNQLIKLKVIYFALLIKIKKIFNSRYDVYEPLESNFNFSPSNIILENYKNPPLKLSFSKTKINHLKWQKLARKILQNYQDIKEKGKL